MQRSTGTTSTQHELDTSCTMQICCSINTLISRKNHCNYALSRTLHEPVVLFFNAGASMHNFHALEAQVFYCLVRCPQHAGQPHLVGHESHLASPAAWLFLSASCLACFSFCESTLHAHVGVSEMGVPPNHRKFDHFSIDTYSFGHPPF